MLSRTMGALTLSLLTMGLSPSSSAQPVTSGLLPAGAAAADSVPPFESPKRPAAPKDVPDSWMDEIRVGIQASEYHFHGQEDGAWSALNRAKGLRARLTAEGLTITSRLHGADLAAGGFALGLRTAA